jgi:C1A family cysteine protease
MTSTLFTIRSIDQINEQTIDVNAIPTRHIAPSNKATASPETLRQWDWREHLQQLSRPRVQGACGACWALAIADTLRDRALVRFGQSTTIPPLSAQFMLNCASGCIRYYGQSACNTGCNGGFIAAALAFVSLVGIPAQQSLPYRGCSGDSCPAQNQSTCPGLPKEAYRADNYYRVNLYATFAQINASENKVIMSATQKERNMLNIQREIRERGPVVGVFNMYSDFLDYWRRAGPNTVYELGWQIRDQQSSTATLAQLDAARVEALGSNAHAQLGSLAWTQSNPGPQNLSFREIHAVSIVGWGETERGIPYWIVRNTWGQTNSQMGYFKIRRGQNAVGIESDVLGCWFRAARTSPLMQHELGVWSQQSSTTVAATAAKDIAETVFSSENSQIDPLETFGIVFGVCCVFAAIAVGALTAHHRFK